MIAFLRRKKSTPDDPYASSIYSSHTQSPHSPGFSPSPSQRTFALNANPSSPSLRSSHSPSPSRSPAAASSSFSPTHAQGQYTASPSASRTDLPLPTPLYARFARSASGTDLRLDFLDQDPALLSGSRRSAADAYARTKSGLGKQMSMDEGEEQEQEQAGRGRDQGRGKDLPATPQRSPTSPLAQRSTNNFAPSTQGSGSYFPPSAAWRADNPEQRRPSLTRVLSSEYKTEEFVHSQSHLPSSAARVGQREENMPPRAVAVGRPQAGEDAADAARQGQQPQQHDTQGQGAGESRPRVTGKLVKPSPRADSLQRFGSPRMEKFGGMGNGSPVRAGTGATGKVGSNGEDGKEGRDGRAGTLVDSPPRSALHASSQFQQRREEQLQQEYSPVQRHAGVEVARHGSTGFKHLREEQERREFDSVERHGSAGGGGGGGMHQLPLGAQSQRRPEEAQYEWMPQWERRAATQPQAQPPAPALQPEPPQYTPGRLHAQPQQQPSAKAQPPRPQIAPLTAPQPFPTSSPGTKPTPLTPPHSPTPPEGQPRRSFLFVSGGKVEPLHRGNFPVAPPPPSRSPTSPGPASPASPASPSGSGGSGPRKLMKKRTTRGDSLPNFSAFDTNSPASAGPYSPRALDGASIAPSLASKRTFAPGAFRSPVSAGAAPTRTSGGGGVFGFVRRLSEARASNAAAGSGGGVSKAAEEAQVRIREGRRRSQVDPGDVDELRRMLQSDGASVRSGAGAGSMVGVGAGPGRRSLDAYGSGHGQQRGPYSAHPSSSTSHVNSLAHYVPARAKAAALSQSQYKNQNHAQGQGHPPQAFGMYGQGRRAASEVDLRHVIDAPFPAPALAQREPQSEQPEAPARYAPGLVVSPTQISTFSGERTPTAPAHAFRYPVPESAVPAAPARTASPSLRLHLAGALDLPARASPAPSGKSLARSVADSTRLGAYTASVYSQESENPDEKATIAAQAANGRRHEAGEPVKGNGADYLAVGGTGLEGRGSSSSLGSTDGYGSGSASAKDPGAGGAPNGRDSTYKSPYLPSNAGSEHTAREQEEKDYDRERTPTRSVAPLNDTNRPLTASASTLRRTPAKRQSISGSSEDGSLRTSVRGPREMDRPERDARGGATPVTPTQRMPASPLVALRPSMDSTSGSEQTHAMAKGAQLSKTSSSASSYVASASSERGAPPSNATSISPPPTMRHRVEAGAPKPPPIPFPKSPERERGHARRPSDPRYKLPPPRTVPPPVIVPAPQEERGPQTIFLSHILLQPLVLAQLLPYLSFRDFLATLHINKPTRAALGDTRILREIILERYLDTVGYHRWPRHMKRDEPITLSLKDLNAYLMGISIATYQYATVAETYLQSQSRDTAALALCRSFTAATRSYTRVVLRLRAQAEVGWDTDVLRSPLYRVGHAPLLRVFVPSPNGGWLNDESVVECEKELRRAGVMKLVRRGDIVWDAAVSDEGNVGRLIWDGNYLLDLEYDYSVSGQLPHYFNSLAHPPSFWHKVIRTNANPIAHIDLRPYGKEIVQNVQLVQDRVQMETPQGGFHTIVRHSHRSVARLVPGTPIPDTKEVVDAAWEGRLIVEAEGTTEGLADLQMRCSSRGGKGVYRILREKSRPGEVWIRCVRADEKLM